MAEGKQSNTRHWLVFIGVCMMMAGGMGLVLNVMGNYFPRIAMEFGLTNADGKLDVAPVTLIMTVYSYVMLVWLPFSGRLYDKLPAQVVFGVAGGLVVLGEITLGLAPNLIVCYIGGAMLGLAGPFIFLVGPSVMINNWFAPSQAGKFLGIASAFTGVGTFFWSPTFQGIIAAQGYHNAFFIEAACSAVLILIPAIFFFRSRPQDLGLEPFGADKEAAAGNAEAAKKSGVAGKFALATVAFWTIFIAGGLISLGGGYKSMMPTAIQSVGGTELAMLGATMVSAAALGNVIGKIVMGTLADIIGIMFTMIVFGVVQACGFLLIFFMLGDNTVPMLIAGFCIGTSDASMSVGLPLVTRTCFGDRCYSTIYSYMNMAIAFLGGLGATFVAMVYNFAGSYQAAYACGAAFIVIQVVCFVIAVTTAKSYKDKWTLEGEPEKSRR